MHHRSRRMRIAEQGGQVADNPGLIDGREPRYTNAGKMYKQDQDAGFPALGWPVEREA